MCSTLFIRDEVDDHSKLSLLHRSLITLQYTLRIFLAGSINYTQIKPYASVNGLAFQPINNILPVHLHPSAPLINPSSSHHHVPSQSDQDSYNGTASPPF